MSSSGMEQTFDIDTSVMSVEQQVKGSKMPFAVGLTGGVDKYTGTQVVGDEFFDWRKNIGPKAQALIGQQTVSARVKIKFVPKNDGSGFFENKELLDIAPLGGLPAMAMPVAGGTVAQPVQQAQPAQAQPVMSVPVIPQPAMPAPAAPAPESAPAAVNPVGEFMAHQEAVEASRTRQGAVRAACEYVAAQAQARMFEGATDADQALRARIKDLTAYVVTGSFPGEVTPESIAADVEGVQVGVPFDTSEEQEAS